MLALAVIIGIICGTITGLTPGIHVNLITVFLLYLYDKFQFDPLFFSVIILSMSITHTFLDCIPSLLFGVPEASMALLPQHQLLHEGKGYEAIKLTLIGSYFCLLLTMFCIPVLLVYFDLFSYFSGYTTYILLAILGYSIVSSRKKLKDLIVTIVAGFLGFIILNSAIREPLFVLLTGFFGFSGLLLSISSEKVPQQIISGRVPYEKDDFLSVILGVFSSMIFTIIPGVGSAHAAFVVQQVFRNLSGKSYLIIVGGINTVNAIVALIYLYVHERARTGYVIAISNLIDLSFSSILVMIVIVIIVGSVAVFLTLVLGKFFVKVTNVIDTRVISVVILCFVLGLTIFLSGFIGLFAALLCCSTGVLAYVMKCRKSNLMACLIAPMLF
ncbi:tripartite tricarboxylate transporter permease [Nanoarchaeota archaeon]